MCLQVDEPFFAVVFDEVDPVGRRVCGQAPVPDGSRVFRIDIEDLLLLRQLPEQEVILVDLGVCNVTMRGRNFAGNGYDSLDIYDSAGVDLPYAVNDIPIL